MVDLQLSVLQPAQGGLGFVAGFAVTDQLIVAAGGTSAQGPSILASSNARHFEPRMPPRELGLRDVLAAGDALWVCGEFGHLAVSRDAGQTWTVLETRTDVCLFGLAVSPEGVVWVVGERGFAARVDRDDVERVDFETTTRLASVYVVKDWVVALGEDGHVYRWRDGDTIRMATGSTQPLTALVVTKPGTWIVIGDGGFMARSPDGAWFSRVRANVEVDLEAIGACSGGQIVVVGDRGIVLISRDDGRTWRPFPTVLTSHLWSVERFGNGVLIGGDDGLIARIAPPGDDTWLDRINVFGGAKPLDAVFADGPRNFVATGLATYLAAIGDDAALIAGDDEEGDGDFDVDDDEADDDDGRDDRDGPAGRENDPEAFALLDAPGDARSFEANHGMPLPAEAKQFFELVADVDPWSSFDELRLDNDLLPDVGDKNLFELLVRRDQQAYLATGLVETFCGVFCIGSLGNGDTYHMELYEWDGVRQVLHYDHDDHAFTGVIADSLDSLAYLAALKLARDQALVSEETYEIGLRKLRGKVAPTWHFAIGDDDPEFVMLDPKRRDTEFFFYRSRWLMALLKNDGVTDIDDIPRLFNVDFNQVVPQDQLPARFEACEKFTPTALYSMWRAYLFDEPELGRYLDIARGHKSRLVRDAAKLIDELREGRNELGTIKDVRAYLARFRALDLDPRRADARKAEAEARHKLEASRKQEIESELARAPSASWADLAWRWLDDGVAHRALLTRLDTRPDSAKQIAALDELRELADEDREIMLPRLAGELSGELEAVLVGSLVRGDALEGVLPRPEVAGSIEGDDEEDDADLDEDDDDLVDDDDIDDDDLVDDDDIEDDDLVDDDDDDVDDDDDDASPGWDAIEAALEPIYKNAEPHAHYGTVLPYLIGGNDPLHGISVYLRTEPVPHFHFVTYGFTDLFLKETEDPTESGFGFELTLRLARRADDLDVPVWVLNLLQNLARYVFTTGNRFAIGHKMGLNGPIDPGHDTKLTALLMAADPELGTFKSELGSAQFIQVVGITDDEYKLIQEWSTTGLVDVLREELPHLVTDTQRDSVLSDATVATEVRKRVEAEGSTEDLSFAGDMTIDVDDAAGSLHIEVGALYAAALPRAMRSRLRLGRRYVLRGRNAELRLRPGSQVSYEAQEGELELILTPELIVEIEQQLNGARAGEYRFEAWPALSITVTPTIIRDGDGRAIDVRGVASADGVREILEADHARFEAEAAESAAVADDDLDDEDAADDDGDANQARNDADAAADAADDASDRARDRHEAHAQSRPAPAPGPAHVHTHADGHTHDHDHDHGHDHDHDHDHDDGEAKEDEDTGNQHREEPPPAADRVRAALAMTRRALRLAPNDDDIQFTHAMLLLDADRAGLPRSMDDLLESLPSYTLSNRLNILTRLGERGHARFADALDVVFASTAVGDVELASFGDVAEGLFSQLGGAVLEHAPDRMAKLVRRLPASVNLLSNLAYKAILAERRDDALALYDRLLGLPIPDAGEERMNYLGALNNACIQAHAAKAYETAVRIADRAQPVAKDNPHIFHSAACAYAAVGAYQKALEQVKLAIAHNYDHLAKLEVDTDLGELLEWPELKAAFREWRTGQDGN